MCKINLNNNIEAQLTANGVDIFVEYWNRMLKGNLTDEKIERNINNMISGGKVKMPLWQFCNIFGDFMDMGEASPIHKNEIIIIDEIQVEPKITVSIDKNTEKRLKKGINL